MSVLSRLFLETLLFVFLSFLNSPGLCSYRDRHVCSCRTSVPGTLASETGLFSFMLNRLQCCQGFPVCRPYKTSSYGGEYDLDDYDLVCFGDVSCLQKESSTRSCVRRTYGTCSMNPVEKYKINNPFGDHSYYNCFPVPKASNDSICLLPFCDSFAAIQRKCVCENFSCVCYGSGETSIAEVVPETHVVFLTFGDNFVTTKGKNVFLTVLVATLVSFLMLSFLLVAFRWIQFPKMLAEEEEDEARPPSYSAISNLNTFAECSSAKRPSLTGETAAGDEDGVLPTYDEAVTNEKRKYCDPPPEYTH